jgi:hypothetical protein
VLFSYLYMHGMHVCSCRTYVFTMHVRTMHVCSGKTYVFMVSARRGLGLYRVDQLTLIALVSVGSETRQAGHVVPAGDW